MRLFGVYADSKKCSGILDIGNAAGRVTVLFLLGPIQKLAFDVLGGCKARIPP
jgi:hypothetical protein